MKVAMYTRVSTGHQTTDNQLIDLGEVVDRQGWTVVEWYDETVSGTKGVEDREALNRLLQDARRKKFEKVIIWSVDRLGRSLKNIIGVISELNDLGIDIFSYKQGIDTSTTMGKSFFHMTSIFAEIENDLRSERQKIGIKRALEKGAKFGRKKKITSKVIDEATRLRDSGLSYRKIADVMYLNVSTIHKAVKLGKEDRLKKVA